MRRTISTFVAAVMLLGSVAACKENDADTRAAESSEKTAPGGIDGSIGDGAASGTLVGDGGGPSAGPTVSGSPGAVTGAPDARATPAGDGTSARFPTGVAEVVRVAVPVENYHALFKQAVAADYRPVYLDGYDVAGRTYLNAIFKPDNGPAWYEYTEMSASGYQGRFDELKAKGYHPVLVESYLRDGQARYAAIWEKASGPAYHAFHGLTAAKMQTLVEEKAAAGLLPVQVSGVTVGGITTYTGLLVKRDLGRSWDTRSTLTAADYQSRFDRLTGNGLRPGYVNAYTIDGSVRFVSMLAAAESATYQARHGLTASQLDAELKKWTKAGYRTRGLAGYDVGGSARFIAFWSK